MHTSHCLPTETEAKSFCLCDKLIKKLIKKYDFNQNGFWKDLISKFLMVIASSFVFYLSSVHNIAHTQGWGLGGWHALYSSHFQVLTTKKCLQMLPKVPTCRNMGTERIKPWLRNTNLIYTNNIPFHFTFFSHCCDRTQGPLCTR